MLEDGYTVGSEFFENFKRMGGSGRKKGKNSGGRYTKVIVRHAGKNNEGVAPRSGF